jgi:hypothetical protein
MRSTPWPCVLMLQYLGSHKYLTTDCSTRVSSRSRQSRPAKHSYHTMSASTEHQEKGQFSSKQKDRFPTVFSS